MDEPVNIDADPEEALRVLLNSPPPEAEADADADLVEDVADLPQA
jgi:hypothetical protein